MDFHLILHNVASIFSAVIILGMAVFTYLNDRHSVANTTFALMLFGAAIFSVSHVVGVNVVDPILSRNILLFNLCMFPTGAFLLHSILAMLGRDTERKGLIIFTYIAAGALTLFFVIFPDLFLLSSVSKMYFPNYYVPGVLNWTRLVFLDIIVFPYILYMLLREYKTAASIALRNRYAYFIVALVCGFCIVYIPNFLVGDIHVDPLIGMFFAVICMVPFAYGAIKYELFNIKVIAKQAFIYSISIPFVGGGLTLLTYGGIWVRDVYPDFPAWTIALVSAVIVVTVSFVVWKQLRESDVLKYEFITTVTHKFRTPLTQIKWATEALAAARLSPDERAQIKYIETANTKLVELIDVLTVASESENVSHEYAMANVNISKMILETVAGSTARAREKNIDLSSHLKPGVVVPCDASKIHFVIQTLIDNALVYTPERGTIVVSLDQKGQDVIVSVRDSGIGMGADEVVRVFNKFYRSESAQGADTEGMGIALFVSREVIVRHGGKMWAESSGLGKGSTFSFTLKHSNSQDS
jgi:signal transduction histidine kinase